MKRLFCILILVAGCLLWGGEYRLLNEDSLEIPHGEKPWLVAEKALEKLLQEKPDLVILFAGRWALKYQTEQEYLASVQRMVQQCQAAKVRPVLVTLPDYGETPADRALQAAIALKRLALRLNLPVVDLYSAQIADGKNGAFFFTANGIRHERLTAEANLWIALRLQSQMQP